MQGCQSAKDLNSGWDGNNYCGRREVGSGVNVYSHGKHMMCPHNKSKEADGHYGPYHAHVPEGFFFACIIGDNVRDHAEPRQNKNIDLWVAKESEEVLI